MKPFHFSATAFVAVLSLFFPRTDAYPHPASWVSPVPPESLQERDISSFSNADVNPAHLFNRNFEQANINELAARKQGAQAKSSKGLKIVNGWEKILIQPFGYDGVRVRISRHRDPTPHPIVSVLLDPPLETPSSLNDSLGLSYSHLVSAASQNASLTNGNLVVRVSNTSTPPGHLAFYRSEKNGQETLLFEEFTDDKALPARYYVQNYLSSTFQSQITFTSTPEEQFYGTGQQACCTDTSVNKKGQTIDLINFNSQIPLPVWMSSKGYLVLFNEASEGRIEFGRSKTRFVANQVKDGTIDYYVTTARDDSGEDNSNKYDTLLKRYTAATGRSRLPPDWSLGYWQSKLRYWNQTQVEDVAEEFNRKNISLSVLVIDFVNWKYQGDWAFDPKYWPDPSSMAAKVKSLTGAEIMVSVWPTVEDASPNYSHLSDNGLLTSTRDGPNIFDSFDNVYVHLIDPTNPESREFLWKRLNETYWSHGIKNFWLDCDEGGSVGEPTLSGSFGLKSFSQYHAGTQEGVGRIFPWEQQHAIQEGFGNLTSPGQYNGNQATQVSLSRSTFAGGQRFDGIVWSGDTQSRFDVLAQQITTGLNMAASAISWWTLDIGGFTGLNIDDPHDRELYVRWFQFGTFLPFQRSHGDRNCNNPTAPPGSPTFSNPCGNEPWVYGETNRKIIESYITLRQTLKPYISSLFHQNHLSGRPFLRSLFFDFGDSDEKVKQAIRNNEEWATQTYMFGPKLLIAPVTKPNVTVWPVYLPKTSLNSGNWKDWWSDKSLGSGGEIVNASAPIETIPVFYLGDKQEILNGNVFE